MTPKGSAKNRSTIVDVARRAGVSTTTVSLVLSGKAQQLRIADETLAKVRQAAEDLNYAPNMLLRSVRRGRTHIVSFYSAFRHRESNDLYMDKMSSAIEYAGGQYGYDVLVHCNFRRGAKDTYQFLNGGWADGLILFAPFMDDPLLPFLRNSGLPTVLMNARDEERVLHSIKDDVHAGMRMVTDNLVAHGHRRIAVFILEDRDHRDARERRSLLESYLATYDIAIPEEYVIRAETPLEDRIRKMMSLPNPPTAIFAWHDRLAYEILEVTDRLGIRVPDDLSIVGYDGLRWPGSTSHVAASVEIDLYEEALRAMRLLDDAINGRLDRVVDDVLPVTFRPGTTLGPAPDHQ